MNIDQVKEHVKKRKVVYSCTATAIVVAGITALIMRDKHIRGAIGVPAQGAIGVLGENVKIKNSILNTVSYISSDRQGPPSWVIRCIETGIIYTSQKSAALEMVLSASHISEHLNGVREHVNGYHFERICMAA